MSSDSYWDYIKKKIHKSISKSIKFKIKCKVLWLGKEQQSVHTDRVNRENTQLFFFQLKIKNLKKFVDRLNTLSHFVILVELFSSNLSAGGDFFFSWLITLWSLIEYFSRSIFLFGSVSLRSVLLVLSLSRIYTPGWPGYDSDFFASPIKFSKVPHLRIDASNIVFVNVAHELPNLC